MSPPAEGGIREAKQFVGTLAKNCKLLSVGCRKTSTPSKCTGAYLRRVDRGGWSFPQPPPPLYKGKNMCLHNRVKSVGLTRLRLNETIDELKVARSIV